MTPLADWPRIFVGIASYRDPECQWTVKDLFAKARHPARVTVGMCLQLVPGEDDDCLRVQTRPEQCRVIQVHAKESKGACWARSRVQSLWQGEEYVLQIDSHMRFVDGWDELLLAMLDECPSRRAVLSTYPMAYEPPDTLAPPSVVTIEAKAFDAQGIVMFKSRGEAPREDPPPPAPAAFVAAGLLFGPSGIMEEVPYDPHLYFQGEEITLAARLWTHGWDIFTPNRPVAWHDYTKRPARPRHWADNGDWGKRNDLSLRRVRHVLGMETSRDPDVLRDIERYGLGQARSLDAYERFSGLDFTARLVQGKAECLPGDAPDAANQAKSRKDVFTAIWQQNGWRCPESRSGTGSTLAATAVLRQRLTVLFGALDIRILVDAGCGDLNWMQTISGDLRLYLGFDIVEGLVAELRDRFRDRRSHAFGQADLVTDTLAEGDAILCRDCLTHLPPAQALSALARFKASKSRYLIATTHATNRNRWVATGGWHPMNLTAAPFNLPAPMRLLSEEHSGTTKSLGVWKLDEVQI